MTIRDYLAAFNALISKRPEVLDLEAVYGRDDEGNGFDKVHYGPTVGSFLEHEFIEETHEDFEGTIDAVCIN